LVFHAFEVGELLNSASQTFRHRVHLIDAFDEVGCLLSVIDGRGCHFHAGLCNQGLSVTNTDLGGRSWQSLLGSQGVFAVK